MRTYKSSPLYLLYAVVYGEVLITEDVFSRDYGIP